MILTKETFNLYAAANYQNAQCLSQDEFDNDLKSISTIKRLLSKYSNGDRRINVILLVNLIVTFYNCFECKAASNILDFRLRDKEKEYLNSILEFLSFPLVDDNKINQPLLEEITKAFK